MTDTVHPPKPMNAPAVFLGIQPGFDTHAPIELYVLLAPVAHHPVGSTVSRQTLEKHGYSLLADHGDLISASVSKQKLAQSAS
jgi:hypothetical protein